LAMRTLWVARVAQFCRSPLNMDDRIKMRNGDALLIIVKNGEVIHYTSNMSLPHVEFVRRSTGQLPEGAWSVRRRRLAVGSTQSVPRLSMAISFQRRRRLQRQCGGNSDDAAFWEA